MPTLSAATLNEGNYQGQYVRVTNLTPQSSFVGEAWATSAKRVVRFDAAGGETVQSYMATATDAAGFAAITIADKTGALLGTAEQNFKNIQVIPTTPSDVAAFVASGLRSASRPRITSCWLRRRRYGDRDRHGQHRVDGHHERRRLHDLTPGRG